MSISTSQQKVDQEKFNQSHDEVYGPRWPKPGKTIYVPGPDGHLVEKKEELNWIGIDPAGAVLFNYQEEVDKLQLRAYGASPELLGAR
jgi:hypothetical protein